MTSLMTWTFKDNAVQQVNVPRFKDGVALCPSKDYTL